MHFIIMKVIHMTSLWSYKRKYLLLMHALEKMKLLSIGVLEGLMKLLVTWQNQGILFPLIQNSIIVCFLPILPRSKSLIQNTKIVYFL